jgi:hypothetical protein
LRLFENRVLRKIFEPMRDETTKEWRRPRNEKLYDLDSSPYIVWMIISRIMRCANYVAGTEDRRCAYRILVGKPEGNRTLERSRPGWEIILK